LSRIHAITVVPKSRFLSIGWPYICWMDRREFHINNLLSQYPGRGTWMILSDVPRACLVVQPNLLRGEVAPSEPHQFREEIQNELPRLASFLEERLGVQGKVGQGIQISDEDLELPY